MENVTYLKGSALFGLARAKARALGIAPDGLKLIDVIREIQVQEGHTACFRAVECCGEVTCCWQASCGAEMKR